MEEKQNCSEIPTNNLAVKRKNNLSTLSKILKSQTYSIQHKASCPDIKRKPSGGLRIFFIKALIGGGAIYLTALLGVWAEAEESTKMYSKLKEAITQIDNENNVKAELFEKLNKSKQFLKGHLEDIPGVAKIYYEKSEKYINNLMKGKKS